MLNGRELRAAATKRLRVRCVFFLFNSPEPYYNRVEAPERKNDYDYTIGPLTIDIRNWADTDSVHGNFLGGSFFLYRVFGIEYK